MGIRLTSSAGVSAMTAAAVAALAAVLILLPDPKPGLPTHVVCHSGGIRVLDDFGTDPGLVEGGIKYRSRTTGRYSRVTGDCAAYDDTVPDGWKPLLPGRSG